MYCPGWGAQHSSSSARRDLGTRSTRSSPKLPMTSPPPSSPSRTSTQSVFVQIRSITTDATSAATLHRPAVIGLAFWRRLLPYIPDWGSPAFWRKVVELIPHKGVQKMKTIVDTIHQRSVDIYQQKKRALEEGDEKVTRQIGEGKDIMSILSELRHMLLV